MARGRGSSAANVSGPAGQERDGKERGRPPRASVLVIGALPPPFVGPFLAMEALIASRAFRERFAIVFCDISDHRDTDNIGRLDWANVGLGVRHFLQFVVLLATRWPQVVYLGISQGTWGYLRDLCFLVPALLLRRRCVLHLRGSEFRTFHQGMPAWLRLMTKWVFRRVSRCIVLGESLRPVMAGLMAPARIRVIPNGIDCQPFDAHPRERDAVGNGKRVLFLSHLMRRKGVFEAVEGFARVRKSHPEARLTLAGGWQNPEDEQRFQASLHRSGLGTAVSFTGVVHGDEKLRVYARHDIFLFPPVEPEGLPWVILEAMAAGLPVISTDQGAIREVVVDGVTGFICEPRAESISERLSDLMADPHRAREMGRRGRERVEKVFSAEAYQEAVARVLCEASA